MFGFKCFKFVFKLNVVNHTSDICVFICCVVVDNYVCVVVFFMFCTLCFTLYRQIQTLCTEKM